jgi:hypothetical protein
MKVLTSDAVQDPTKVEARVRREVAMRKHNHVKMNEERKLTPEQRREKIEMKKLEEEKKGIFGAVFKYVFFNSKEILNIHQFFGTKGLEISAIPLIDSKSARMQNRWASLVSQS